MYKYIVGMEDAAWGGSFNFRKYAQEKIMSEDVNTNVEAQAEGVQLSLQDIATMVQIIDICSKRGGFEGPELEAVGGLRSRIVAFLEEASKGQETPEGAVPEVAATEDDSSES